MTLSRFLLLVCCTVLGVSTLAQTTTLPDFDKGRLWGSPLALLSTGLHGAYILDEPAEVGGVQGARLEINVLDRKARAYVLWRVDKSDASRDASFVEYGLGIANLGELGGATRRCLGSSEDLRPTWPGATHEEPWSGSAVGARARCP